MAYRATSENTIYRIIKTIMEGLFEAETRRLNKAIEIMNGRNNEAKGTRADAFLYDGITFRPLEAPKRGFNKQELHHSLVPDMELHMQDVATIEDDRKSIEQLLFMMLSPCTEVQGARDALPDCLARMIPDLAKMERRYELAWSIKTDPRAMKQFEKLMPRIEMYAAARMLY